MGSRAMWVRLARPVQPGADRNADGQSEVMVPGLYVLITGLGVLIIIYCLVLPL